jgi:amidase
MISIACDRATRGTPSQAILVHSRLFKSVLSDYDTYDALGMAELVRRGELSPSQLVEEAIARIERLNPGLNAVIHTMYERGRREAEAGPPDGPFRGVPFLIKDLVAMVAGEPMRAGSRFLRDFVPDHDTELFARYRSAGLVTLGKTNTPELGLTPFTEPALFGPTANPWDSERTAGGSSGGSAAAVAAGMVPVAGGGDGGGSIRIPASCCGIFGLKPTRGRTPLGPDRGELWRGCVVEHVLSRSVRDSAALLDWTAGPDVGAPYVTPPPGAPYLTEAARDPAPLRIAFTTRPMLGPTVHPDCVEAVHDTVGLLQSLGHHLEEATPEFDGGAFARNFMVMIVGECRGEIEEAERLTGRRAGAPDFEGETWALGLLGKTLSAAEYVTATRLLQADARRIGRFFTRWDMLLTPTVSMPPPPTGSLLPPPRDRLLLRVVGRFGAGRVLRVLGLLDEAAATAFEFTPWTPVANVTGQPAMSVPLHWNRDGLPIGVQFMAPFGDEATLFRLAGQLERARPWFGRRPSGPGGSRGARGGPGSVPAPRAEGPRVPHTRNS